MRHKWPKRRIGDICEVVNGGTPKTNVSAYWGGTYNWITPAEMGKRLTPYVSETERKLTSAGIDNSSATLLPPESVILSSRAPIGHLVINRVAMATNQGCKGLIPRDGLDCKYLYYCLLGNVPYLQSLGTGTTFKELSGGRLKEVEVTFPSDAEQRRVVGILDEAFSGMATAKANAEENLRNATALFDSYLQSAFTQRRKGWIETTLGEVCDFDNGDRGTNYPNRREYVASGIPWINTGHIQRDGTLSLTEMNYITREKYSSLRSGKIRPGDVVYCLRGATLGKTALVAPYTEGAVASSLVIIRPHNALDSQFLYFFLTSPVGRGLIKGYENGAAQPNLGSKSVAKYPISIPTLSEQNAIVRDLVTVASGIRRIEANYTQKIAALDNLKQALLQRAFAGDL